MKNIEKFPRTNDALEAWRQSVEGGVYLSFDEWAQREYEATRAPTLLEAAEAVKTTWHSQWQYGSLSIVAKAISNLSDAIDREKEKPVRNCDRFATAKEAYKVLEKSWCSHCRFADCGIPCVLAWIYSEAEKEGER